MGKHTKIEWADSSVNGQAGCDGCELWHPRKGGTCYAALLTERYKGQKGWPVAFDQPVIFPQRITDACKWADMRGTVRPDKPWIHRDTPRLIFLDDMGDTFTESLPLDWLMPHISTMEASPHIWQFLTKRPRRMRLFFEELGYVPSNFWLGTSVTSSATMRRVDELAAIPNAMRWLSIEPLFGEIDLTLYAPALDWIVIGGESGQNAKPMAASWVKSLMEADIEAVFIKQLGTAWAGSGKGGDWSKWPEWARVRQMPKVRIPA